MKVVECAGMGIAALLMLVCFVNWTSAGGMSDKDFDSAIALLRRDLGVQSQNNMNVLNSLLQRISQIEKHERIIVPRKYKIIVDGKPR